MSEDIRKEIEENGFAMVHSCSGLKEHRLQCDGNCEETRVTALILELDAERDRWAKLGMNTQGVTIDMFMLECSVLTLIEILVDKLGLTKDEINEQYFRPKVLQRLTEVREANEEEIRLSRIGASGGSTLVGPHGEKLIQ